MTATYLVIVFHGTFEFDVYDNFIKKEPLHIFLNLSLFKGNTQFLILYYPRKTDASLAYTTLPWITQKTATDTFHWLDLITFGHSKLCKSFQFEKDIHLYFSIFQKICRKIKVQRSYFGKIASFLSLEFSFLRIYRCRPYIAMVVVDFIIL